MPDKKKQTTSSPLDSTPDLSSWCPPPEPLTRFVASADSKLWQNAENERADPSQAEVMRHIEGRPSNDLGWDPDQDEEDEPQFPKPYPYSELPIPEEPDEDPKEDEATPEQEPPKKR